MSDYIKEFDLETVDQGPVTLSVRARVMPDGTDIAVFWKKKGASDETYTYIGVEQAEGDTYLSDVNNMTTKGMTEIALLTVLKGYEKAINRYFDFPNEVVEQPAFGFDLVGWWLEQGHIVPTVSADGIFSFEMNLI